MFKFVTLAFLGVVTCFNQEESVLVAKKSKSAGATLKAYNDAKKAYDA
jgi:hypothetical protein